MSSRSTDSFIRALADRFECRISDPALLEQALTHRSCGSRNNERLEFLGDAVLNLVVASMLFQQRSTDSEGDLSRLRARLVRERTLAEVARELELGDWLRLGPGELKSGGHLRDSILADTLEAVLGAVYLADGFDAAADLIHRLLGRRLAGLPTADQLKDAKTRLQEWLQARGHDLPEYRIVEEHGADHARRFIVACRAGEPVREFVAEAGSRRKAEQAAAAAALRALEPEAT